MKNALHFMFILFISIVLFACNSEEGGTTAPTDTAPTDTVPTDTVPTDTIPTDTVPTDTIPTDTVPTDTIPMDTVSPATYELAPLTLELGGVTTGQLTLEKDSVPVDGGSVTWTSNNTDVATVDASGLVTSVSMGNADITAAYEDTTITTRVTVALRLGLDTVNVASGDNSSFQNTYSEPRLWEMSQNRYLHNPEEGSNTGNLPSDSVFFTAAIWQENANNPIIYNEIEKQYEIGNTGSGQSIIANLYLSPSFMPSTGEYKVTLDVKMLMEDTRDNVVAFNDLYAFTINAARDSAVLQEEFSVIGGITDASDIGEFKTVHGQPAAQVPWKTLEFTVDATEANQYLALSISAVGFYQVFIKNITIVKQ
jgi:hypothetical protein